MVQKKSKPAAKKPAPDEKTGLTEKKKKSPPAEAEVKAPKPEAVADAEKKHAAAKVKAEKKPSLKTAAKKKTTAEKPAEHLPLPEKQAEQPPLAEKPKEQAPLPVKPAEQAHPPLKPETQPPAAVKEVPKKIKPKLKKETDSAAVFTMPSHAVKAKPEPAKPAPKPEVKAPVEAPQAKPPVEAPKPQAAAAQSAAAPAAGEKPSAAVPEPPEIKGEIKINELTTIRELADKMNVKPGDLLKKLIGFGTLATINQRLDKDVSELLAHEFNYDVKFVSVYAEDSIVEVKDDPSTLKFRPPVVTIMGHVDHGKTSLLDAIRTTDVAGGEAGGITQHIGAYKVTTAKGQQIAFLDTPGHEAFTAMRSRGAKATDIVVLVVSAADGVMPQTVEAIDHARAAGVPIIVAINKVDIPTANPQQIKQELSKFNLMAEDWGGDTIMVEVSAKRKTNIDQLLDMIVLKSEMMELKANPNRLAQGLVIEAKLDSKKGPLATLLVENGTLKVGDNIVVGTTYGKVRAMLDEHGHKVETAPPSTPVEILGMNTPPQAGDKFFAVEQEYQAREIAESRNNRAREEALKPRHHLSLEDISAGKAKDLRIILKTDVQGSLGAVADSLERLSTNEINLKIIHSGAGGITESDVTLAAASDAVIMGFNIRPDTAVERFAEQEGVSIRVYRIIYELIADVKAAMEGMLEPSIKETCSGKAQIKQVFKITKAGMVSGCMVIEGKIARNCKARIVRDNVIVYEGAIASIRRFKDDVKDVEKGFECGITLENFGDMKPGDIIEAFTQEKVARKL